MEKNNIKRIYRKLISFIERLAVKIHIFKTFFCEWISILNKSKQYKNVKWTDTQQSQFDDYWKKHYGKKISNRWHKLYQSANGVFNIKYFPEIFFTTRLEPKLNPYYWCISMSDKSLVELLYSGNNEKKIKFPRTLILNASGIYYDGNRNIISKARTIDILLNCDEAVIKPIRGSSSGKGVKVLMLSSNKETESEKIIKNTLIEYNENFIIQERIEQNMQYSNLHYESVNTIRIITYVDNDKLFHAPIALRVGTKANRVDNIHSGGIVIGVSDSGELNPVGYDNYNTKYTEHPDSKIRFSGYKIPYIKEIIELSYWAHGRTPHIGIISWDICVNDKNEIVILEINLLAQSIWFPQIIHGKPIFGDNTEEMIHLISKKR